MEHHEHHHDHGPDCTCGCHDHHEHPEHHHEDRIRVERHDVSCVGSLTLKVAMEYSQGVRLFGELLSKVASAVTEHGGIVGHIKALVTDMSRNSMLSVTDEEEAIVTEYVSYQLAVEIACIVMALEPECLKHILLEHFDTYL